MKPFVTEQQINKPSCSTSSINSVNNDAESCIHQDSIEDDARLAARLAYEEEVSNNLIDCSSDTALAQILQKQFDIEYDKELLKQENRLNGQSKVGISLVNFKRASKRCDHVKSSEDYIADEDPFFSLEKQVDSETAAWDSFEHAQIKQRSRTIGRSGFFVDGQGNVITKHDIPTTSRRNMCRLMELKTDIRTGDAGAPKDDFKINNNVYNSLKVHSKKSSRRASQKAFEKRERENDAILQDIHSVKMSDATRAIMDGLLITFKIEKLNGVIGHGKESSVLHATGLDHEDTPDREVAIKIFRSDTSLAFKTRNSYSKNKCPSYKFDKPKSKGDLLNRWAERSFKNLKLMRRHNISCPDAISLRKHVLIMTFLGSDAKPSPQLKEANLDEDQLKKSYEQIIAIMMKMYQKCELIHSDLSEYNLLWHKEELYVIDVSQAVFTSHPLADSFLYRDCMNILDFYERSGLENILKPKELFKMISGKDLDDKDLETLYKIEDFPKNEKLMQQYDHHFEQIHGCEQIKHLMNTSIEQG